MLTNRLAELNRKKSELYESLIQSIMKKEHYDYMALVGYTSQNADLWRKNCVLAEEELEKWYPIRLDIQTVESEIQAELHRMELNKWRHT